MNQQKNYIQLIYRLLVGLLSIGFLYVIFPFISSVLLMLIFSFLFTTILLTSVDALERKIRILKFKMILINSRKIYSQKCQSLPKVKLGLKMRPPN